MSNSSPKRIVFLFGSGISFCAGMPKLHEITERVLSGKCVYYYNETFFSEIRPSADPAKKWEKEQQEYVQRIVKFLHRLKVEIDYYYEKRNFRREANYEDLYYVSGQIADSIFGDIANPVVQSFFDKIFLYIQPLLGKPNYEREWSPEDLADKATQYIQIVVCYLLSKKPFYLDYLSCIKDICQDDQVSQLDIFTLNHDTVLETYFERNNIQFSDGFFKPAGEENRCWKSMLFNSGSFKVRLFKLHGSINWFRLRPLVGDWSDDLIGIPSLSDKVGFQIKDAKGRILFVDKRPMLLVGTYNKMLEYTRGIYQELRFQFYLSLRRVKELVICGYGFGDEGINTDIIEWIYSSPKNRLIVIHHNPKELRKKARTPIKRPWDEWEKQKRLEIIEKRIEKTSWSDITKHSCFIR